MAPVQSQKCSDDAEKSTDVKETQPETKQTQETMSKSSKEAMAPKKEEEPAQKIPEPTAEDKEPKTAEALEETDQATQEESAQIIGKPSDDLEDVEIAETEGIGLKNLIVARGVEKRQPVEPGTSFSIVEGGRMYAIMDVKNPSRTENKVSVSWIPVNGKWERGVVKVSIGAQMKWRTWAYTRAAKKAGKWIVLVRDSEGKIIGRAPFKMTE